MIFSLAIIYPVYHLPVNLKHLIFGELLESAELRNHLCSKPFHLIAILDDVLSDGVQQDHLRAAVDDLADPADHLLGVPDTGTASMPGMSP
jgi:hypothetical protein